jgi:hypothetical protein
MSYKARYSAAEARASAQRTRRILNQNITTSEADVRAVRAEEAVRRAQGKPPARVP